jgi:hypothetical protein
VKSSFALIESAPSGYASATVRRTLAKADGFGMCAVAFAVAVILSNSRQKTRTDAGIAAIGIARRAEERAGTGTSAKGANQCTRLVGMGHAIDRSRADYHAPHAEAGCRGRGSQADAGTRDSRAPAYS